MVTPTYCVYTNNKGERILGIPTPDYFASAAFIKYGNFDGVAGYKFGIITGDDAKQYCVNKSRITPVKNEDELNILKAKTCPEFTLTEELRNIPVVGIKAYMDTSTFWAVNGVIMLKERGYSEEQIKEYYKGIANS